MTKSEASSKYLMLMVMTSTLLMAESLMLMNEQWAFGYGKTCLLPRLDRCIDSDSPALSLSSSSEGGITLHCGAAMPAADGMCNPTIQCPRRSTCNLHANPIPWIVVCNLRISCFASMWVWLGLLPPSQNLVGGDFVLSSFIECLQKDFCASISLDILQIFELLPSPHFFADERWCGCGWRWWIWFLECERESINHKSTYDDIQRQCVFNAISSSDDDGLQDIYSNESSFYFFVQHLPQLCASFYLLSYPATFLCNWSEEFQTTPIV